MEKIELTYEDMRNVMIHDMRSRFTTERPIYDVYQYYIGWNACGMLAATTVQNVFANIYPNGRIFNIPVNNENYNAVFLKEKIIHIMTENLESMWGIVKVARHMHLIKNTVNFKDT